MTTAIVAAASGRRSLFFNKFGGAVAAATAPGGGHHLPGHPIPQIPGMIEEMMNTQQDGKFRHIRLFIFDLDGTLIDSEQDLALSVNAMLRRMRREPLSQPVISSYVGQGVTVLVRRALGPSASEAEVEDAAAFFLDYYRGHMLDNTALYPGAREALEGIESRQLAVLTNKPIKFTQQILAGLEVDRFFSFVYGGDSFEQKKPHPVGVLRLMEQTGAATHETLMIGDSATDVETGRNAGVQTCGVTYGIGSPTLASLAPDLVLDDLRELLPLAGAKLPAGPARDECAPSTLVESNRLLKNSL
ncbi:MAG: HAD-IA family hydrolase [Terriglobia bacterium]